MDILNKLASYFEPYITLERVHPTATYDYKARNMYRLPVFDYTLHRPKCSSGSWTYVAVTSGADLKLLGDSERLYVGSQTIDRMFRGDHLGGKNFHHAQMRAGNGKNTPEAFLRAGNRIDIYRLPAEKLADALDRIPELAVLRPIFTNPSKHPGYWLEQYILETQNGRWRWNTSGAAAEVRKLLRLLGHGA